VFKLDSMSDLSLPIPIKDEQLISEMTITCNRAPVLLAFAFTLLSHTHSEQPVSSQLSLAGGLVAGVGRLKAVNIGVEKGTEEAEDSEGFGKLKLMGREIKTVKRLVDGCESQETDTGDDSVWAIDMDAWKKLGAHHDTAGLPIHTPQSARSYLVRSFEDDELCLLLGAIEMLLDSWKAEVNLEELDKKAWSWYLQIRPSVPDGLRGWGAKGEMKLSDILALRKT
jgi:hypothetical protein